MKKKEKTATLIGMPLIAAVVCLAHVFVPSSLPYLKSIIIGLATLLSLPIRRVLIPSAEWNAVSERVKERRRLFAFSYCCVAIPIMLVLPSMEMRFPIAILLIVAFYVFVMPIIGINWIYKEGSTIN